MPDKTLDVVGMKCPRPLFEIIKEIKAMQSGQILEVIADDPAFKPDIEAWCMQTGNVLQRLTRVGNTIIVNIQKK